MSGKLNNFTDVLGDPNEICDSQPLSFSPGEDFRCTNRYTFDFRPDNIGCDDEPKTIRPARGTGQHGEYRSVDEIDPKYRSVFEYPFFNLVQSRVIDDALYSDKSMVICAPTGSGKTVVFEMAIVNLLMELDDSNENHDFKIIYIAPVKALCTERLTEWYAKFTKLGLLCIEVTGDTDVDFSQLKPYRIIITTPEKWDMLTRRWRDHRQLVEVIKLFLIDEVHILNDSTRGPVLEAVVSRMKTIETSVQSTHRIEKLQQQYQGTEYFEISQRKTASPSIRFVAASATVGNPEDVAAWLGTAEKPAVYYKFGDECRPVKLRRVVEGYPCSEGTSIFKFDIILNYKLWPIIQRYYNGKPTLIFCNTRKSVILTAETLSKVITINFNPEHSARLQALASTIKTKKLQTLVMSGVGCHHAGLLFEERNNIEQAFRDRDLPILITTTTLAMGVNLPAHLVIVKNTQQYVNGAYQEYSISTVLQMVGRAGRPQFDTEATAVIMTRLCDKQRYQGLVGGSEPLQSYLHKRLPENLNSEAALGTVTDVAQCVQWLRSTFLCVRAAKDPKRYLGLPQAAPQYQISKKIEELCVKAMNGLASSGLITMDEACCIESTEAGRLMSIYYLDLETMKHIMKIEGSESLERLLWIVCESHELADMHLRTDERRCLNLLNRNNAASTIRFPMKGKINTRQMKLNCIIQAILGCLPIPDPSLNQEATKVLRIADRVCKCMVAYVTRSALISQQPKFYSAVLNTIILKKCVAASLWENSPFVSKQLRGIGPAFSNLLATAGKVNFMLLEESHPRDLERIMNKGPPAGNILRKQISLLPKYQLTMTPVDEKVVSIQLNLLNHNNLAENVEHMTAGASHKSYVIIGDSENILLLFTSFTDKDLIRVYDGSITYQVTRKYGFEHKIFAHCVSSAFAGLDAQCEYVFQNIEPQTPYSPQQLGNTDEAIKRTTKQTTITETFRERKRKNTDNEIAQSKEKKKRVSALFEKFKNLKESFGKTSKELKQDLNKSAAMSSKIIQELGHTKTQNEVIAANTEEQKRKRISPVKSNFFEDPITYDMSDEDVINDEFLDDDKVNNLILELESEMRVSSKIEPSKTNLYNNNENNTAIQEARHPKYTTTKTTYPRIETYKQLNDIKKRGTKTLTKKSNYNFIDLLEKNDGLSDDEEAVIKEQNTFSDTVKAYIDKYLQKTKINAKTPDKFLIDHSPEKQINSEDDIDMEQSNKPETRLEPVNKSDQNTESPNTANEPEQTDKDKIQESSAIDSIDLTTDYEQKDVDSIIDFHEISTECEKAASMTTKISKGSKNIGDIKQDDINFGILKITPRQDGLSQTSASSKQSADDRVIDKYPELLISTQYLLEFDAKFEFPEVNLAKNNKEGRGVAPSSNSAGVVQSVNMPMLSESLPNDLTGISCITSRIEDQNPTIEPKKTEETTNLLLPNTLCLISETEDQNLTVEPKTSKIFKNINTMDKASSSTATDNEAIELQKDLKREGRQIIAPNNMIMPYLPLKPASHYSFYNNDPAAVCSKTCLTKFNDNLEYPDIESSNILSKLPFRNNLTFSQQRFSNSNNMMPMGTGNPATEFQEKQQLQAMIQLDNKNKIREVLTSNASLTGGLENKPKNRQMSYKLTHPNNQTHYTNTYSFSSNKIGVSTKETEDHVLRITRKLRIDVDVIVSQEKKTKSDCKGVTDIRIATPRQDYHESEYEALSLCNENNMIPALYSSEFKKDEKESPKANSEPIKPNIKSNIPRREEKEENNRNDNENTDKNNKTHNKFYTDYGENDSLSRKPTNVQSILQKYSSNMRNKNSKTDDLLPSQTKTYEKSSLKKEKPIRPFRISDINYVTKPLPDGIVEKTKADSREEDESSQMEQYKHSYDVTPLILPNFTPKQQEFEVVNRTQEKYETMKMLEGVENIPDWDGIVEDLEEKDIDNTMFNPKTLLQCYENNSSDIIPPPLSEFDDDLNETLDAILKIKDLNGCDGIDKDLEEENTDIVNTMFNPKTLLQCYEKNSSDIIPPPPEFGDDPNETLDATDDLIVPMTCYEPMHWNDDEKDSSYTEANQSIFDDTQVELTPSREIETWNLTNEQGIGKIHNSSPYSFTILRKNRELTAYNSQNKLLHNFTATPLRYNKLKQFKKQDKVKLRPKYNSSK